MSQDKSNYVKPGFLTYSLYFALVGGGIFAVYQATTHFINRYQEPSPINPVQSITNRGSIDDQLNSDEDFPFEK